MLRVTVPMIGVHALVKFHLGQMRDQLGKDGAARSSYHRILAAPVRCFQTPFARPGHRK